jgi:hypothetical protein
MTSIECDLYLSVLIRRVHLHTISYLHDSCYSHAGSFKFGFSVRILYLKKYKLFSVNVCGVSVTLLIPKHVIRWPNFVTRRRRLVWCKT